MRVRSWISTAVAGVLLAPIAQVPLAEAQVDPRTQQNPAESSAIVEITDTATPTLAPDADITLTYTVTNTSSEALNITYLQFRSQNTTASSSSSLAAWLANDVPSYRIHGEDVDLTVPAGATVSQSVTIDREAVSWSTDAYTWGPRGIQIQLFSEAGETFTDRSILIVTPDAELIPMPLTAVVPVTTDPATLTDSISFRELVDAASGSVALGNADADDPNPTATDGAEAAALAGTDAASILADWSIAGVSLAVDPVLLDTASAGASDVIALPMHDADLAAFAHSSVAPDVARQFVADSSAAVDGLDVTTGVVIPETSVDSQTLAYAHNLGLNAALVDSQSVPQVDPTFYVPHAHTTFDVTGEPMSVVVADTELSRALTGTLEYGDSTLELSDLDRRQVLLALSANNFRDLPNAIRANALRLNRGDVYGPEADVMLESLESLMSAPWVEPVGLSDVLATDPVDHGRVELSDQIINDGEITNWEDAQAALDDARTFSTVFDNSADIDATVETAVDTLAGVAWRQQPSLRESAIAGIAPSATDRSSIQVESSSTINMISETSALPVQVSNDFPYPVTITVSLDTPDSRLQASEPVEARIDGGATAQVPVPVEAWGSGNITVGAHVTNADGDQVGQSQDIDVRVRAEWENWGTLIVAGLFGALFVVGLVKSIRQGRRSEPISPRRSQGNVT